MSMSALRRCGGWLLALWCAASAPIAAQTAPPAAAVDAGGGVTLEDALRITLRDNPSIQLAARASDTERGALVASADAFDSKVQTAFGSSRVNSLQADASTSNTPWLDVSQTQYSLGLQKTSHQGIVVSPELDVTRVALPGLGLQPTSQSTARLNVLVPLLKDRGGRVTTASERAARDSYDGSRFETQHVTAQSILSAVTAYWDYQAAITRLDVVVDSEARAQRLFEDTRRLVEAGERPPSDLAQVRGNVAAKRVTRMSAEQAVVDARVGLGLAMGLSTADTAALRQATTPFPGVDDAAASAVATPALIDQALIARPDLRATDKNVESARVLFDAAREDLKPRVDLVGSLGYAGLRVGGDSLTSLFSPVFRNVPGPDLAFSLRYQWATDNAGPRGRLLQAESGYEQERIAQRDLQRQIRTGIYRATEAIGRNATAMTEAHEAVTLYQTTVRSEERKFQLGVSTLFDTIQAADALTNVKLSEISVEREYAVAIATLRFQTGSLVEVGSQGATVDVARLLSPR